MNHDTQLPPAAFAPLHDGTQRAVILPEYTPVRLGDLVTIREHLPHRNLFTDRTITAHITHIQKGDQTPGLMPGFTLVSIERIQDAPPRALTNAQASDTKPAGWMITGEVLEATPAAIVVLDTNGERHVFKGDAWTPEAQPTDSVLLTMTPDGFRLRVIDRQCKGHEIEPVSDRCGNCGLAGEAVRTLNSPCPF